jgi:hypothetical protein
MRSFKVLFTLGLLLLGNLAARAADDNKPLKVFNLAGQSNMEGQAVVDLDGKNYNDGKGTLKFLFKIEWGYPYFALPKKV